MTDITSLDSGFDAMEGLVNHTEASIHIRVTMPEDPSYQTMFIIRPLDLVWTLKQKVLDSITHDLKDPLNYGFYCPPSNNRVGKYLDEERPIKEYPLSIPIGLLEFKYKRKLHKTDINPLKLKKMHTPAELKIFLELVRRGDVDQITAKMSKGFDPNFNSSGKGETPMTLAATLSRPGAMILALVGGGAFIDYRNKSGLTPLHIATMCGNKDAVRILLDLGSSPNYKDAKGLTPLFYTTMKETPAVCIQWLLQERADIGRRDENGWMEIHRACERGLAQHLEQLLYYGADRNALTLDTNDTPLHICARSNQANCARLLLLRGADKAIKNKSNQDAEQTARALGNESVVKCISEFRPEQVELFNDVPRYNEKRRGTISMVTLRNLQRSRSNPNLLQQLFQQDPVLSATMSQATGVQYVSNGLVPNGVKSPGAHSRPPATDLFGTGTKSLGKGESFETSSRSYVEKSIELRRSEAGFGFILRGPVDPPGSSLNFMPTPDIPARQYIESVEPGSTAAKAGLEAGDFVIEINGQNVICESHKDCVRLMRNCGDVLKLKIVKIQHMSSQSALAQDVGKSATTASAKVKTGSGGTNSLSSNSSSQAKSTLAGLEALENLDAALDRLDSTVVSSSEEHCVTPQSKTSEEEEEEEATLPPEVALLPPPPAYDDAVEMSNVEVPEPVLNEEVVLVLSSIDSLPNGHSEPFKDTAVDRDVEKVEKKADEALIQSEKDLKVEDNSGKKKSAALAFAAVNSGSGRLKSSAESSRLSILTKTDEGLVSVVEQKEKKYQAPSAPSARSSTVSVSPAKVAVASTVVVSSNKASDVMERSEPVVNESNASADFTSTAVPPPPPPPPPPGAIPPPSATTLPRLKVAAEASDNDKTLPSKVQRQLDETRKREESHAALMAAVLKRKNVLESSDSDVLAESIDARVDRTRKLQKTVYRADNTKEVKSPPANVAGVGLLVNPDNNQIKGNDMDSGFSAEAEKIRQAFVLKKSTSVTLKEQEKDGNDGPSASVGNKKADASFNSERLPVENGNGAGPRATNGASNGEVGTINRTLNRPKSAVVTTSQPVLADVAAIIAQKALERQKKEENAANVASSGGRSSEDATLKVSAVSEKKSVTDRRSMFEVGDGAKPLVSPTSPRNTTSKVYTSAVEIKVIDGNSAASASSVTKSAPGVTTLQSKKYGASVTASTPAPKTTSVTAPALESNTLKSSNRFSTGVSTSVIVNGSQSTATLSKQREINGKDAKKVPEVNITIPPPVEFSTPSQPSSTLRNVTKSTQSNSMVFRAKSSTGEANAAKKFQERSIQTWSEKDIEDWLHSLDYPEYGAAFRERKITGPDLARLSANDLETMGVKNPLHRIRFEKEIRKAMNIK